MTNPLHIVGTPIGNLGDISARAMEVLSSADVVACEDTRRTGSLLSKLGIRTPSLIVLNDHSERAVTGRLVAAVESGRKVALVSDAGMPLISDPGWLLVNALIDAGGEVDVVPGPTAVTSALVLSGLPADRYFFEGFLPRAGSARLRRMAELVDRPVTSVIYESPHRLAQTLDDLGVALGADRRVAVIREITKLHQDVWRTTLGEAAARAGEARVRGEIVIVVGPAPSPEPATDDDIIVALRRLRGGGATNRDAVEAVAEELGVSRRRAYEISIRHD